MTEEESGLRTRDVSERMFLKIPSHMLYNIPAITGELVYSQTEIVQNAADRTHEADPVLGLGCGKPKSGGRDTQEEKRPCPCP